MNKFWVIAVVAACMTAGTAQAVGDVARGKAKSVTCAACHGVDGNSVVPTFPRLAGQHADYLARSLRAYQTGARKNEVMKGMVAPLTSGEIEDLAAYFASQTGLVLKK